VAPVRQELPGGVVSLYRRNPRKDGNHASVVGALRHAGASVLPLSSSGCPDLLVGFLDAEGTRRNVLIEIKRPLGPNGGESRSKLNVLQEQFRREWRGDRVWVVRSPLEAVAVLGYSPGGEP
jgi:hypothetical protein